MPLSKRKQQALMKKLISYVDSTIQKGENPFACFLLDEKGKIVMRSHNKQNSMKDRTAHAEVSLIRKASKKLGTFYFKEYSIMCNCEPCSMCSSLLIKAKIKTIYYGAPMDKGNDPYLPAEEIMKYSKHKIKIIGGILEESCKKQIYEKRREKF